jgi:hypothetical protein
MYNLTENMNNDHITENDYRIGNIIANISTGLYKEMISI